MKVLGENSVADLFKTVLQHMKCIQTRMEYASVNTSQKQKYVLNNAIRKVEGAVNHICDLLPNSDKILEVKKELDKAELVYVMIYTEQLMRANADDLENIATIIEDYMDKKYGKPQEPCPSSESAVMPSPVKIP